MSQMPAAQQFATQVSRPLCKHPGYIFTGKVIDKCSVIEAWAVKVLDELRALAATPPDPKLPFLGLKLGAIKLCAQAEPGLFKRPADVIRLLNDLEPLIKLRSRLAHAVVDAAVRLDGDFLFIFELSCVQSKSLGEGRLVFSETGMREVGSRLADLSNQLCQQDLKATAKPSS